MVEESRGSRLRRLLADHDIQRLLLLVPEFGVISNYALELADDYDRVVAQLRSTEEARLRDENGRIVGPKSRPRLG